jgi:hypothetical protein
MKRRLVLIWTAMMLAGCSAAPTSSPSTPPSSAHSQANVPVGATIVPGGCGATAVVTGHVPTWLDEAGAHNNPDAAPYVLAVPQQAAGFIFGYPLRSGHPENPSNKILWVVGLPRNGSSLEISAHPLGAATPTLTQIQPADSSPGEIYPSIVDVPQPGCWHFDLTWAGHKASVELVYQ